MTISAFRALAIRTSIRISDGGSCNHADESPTIAAPSMFLCGSERTHQLQITLQTHISKRLKTNKQILVLLLNPITKSRLPKAI